MAELAARIEGWGRRLARAWRVFATGLAFAAAGSMASLLAITSVPVLMLVQRSPEQRQLRFQRLVHHACRTFLRALELLGLARIRCIGAERLREPGTLVVANHPTQLDALLLMSLMPNVDCVIKESYYHHPFLGGAARAAGYIPSRDGPGLVAACVERLVRGRSLMIFPEGTRSPAKGLGPFQRGAAHIALRAGRDPVPVAITCEPPTLYPGQSWWDVPDRRFDLVLRVGEPLPVKEAVGEQQSYGRGARALTAMMRGYLESRTTHAEC